MRRRGGVRGGQCRGHRRRCSPPPNRAGVERFVHVSSLAAREPGLSLYGASKARSEALVDGVAAVERDRPPARGLWPRRPRDARTVQDGAGAGWSLLPPAGKLSLIHVDDLARLLLALAASEPNIARRARRRPPRRLDPPRVRRGAWPRRSGAASAPSPPRAALLRLAARADTLVRGRKAKLTARPRRLFLPPRLDRRRPTAPRRRACGRPQIDTEQGLAATARWYRGAKAGCSRRALFAPHSIA